MGRRSPGFLWAAQRHYSGSRRQAESRTALGQLHRGRRPRLGLGLSRLLRRTLHAWSLSQSLSVAESRGHRSGRTSSQPTRSVCRRAHTRARRHFHTRFFGIGRGNRPVFCKGHSIGGSWVTIASHACSLAAGRPDRKQSPLKQIAPSHQTGRGCYRHRAAPRLTGLQIQ